MKRNEIEPRSGPSNRYAEADELTPPDGGWGWAVVLAVMMISVIAGGISFSFGLLYIELILYFRASRAKTSWIGSLFTAVPLLSGPIMGSLVDKYGCRKVTVAGGLLSAFGFVLASVSPSIEYMLLTFGVITGFGIGMCYVGAVVSITFWFEKKRGLAIGLGSCGNGIGIFMYAPMTQYLILMYGWRGCVIILAGTLLNMCVCGCVFRDPAWLKNWKREHFLRPATSRGGSIADNQELASVLSRLSFQTSRMSTAEMRRRPSVSYSRSVASVHMYRNATSAYRLSRMIVSMKLHKRWYTRCVTFLKTVLDLSLFRETHFLLMQISKYILFAFYIVPYFYVADHMASRGYSEEQGAMSLSLIGIANTIGMISLGWAGDQYWVDATKAYAGLLIGCGMTVLLIPLVTHVLWLTWLVVAAFGFLHAGSFTFTPVILVEMVPMEKFTSAYGLTLMCEGLGNLIGPPLAGWIYDMTGSWDLSFYTAGVSIMVSGALVGAIAFTRNRTLGSS